MSNIVVMGAQWGDEGKGKIVDLLTSRFDIVVRYQGGHNAGHTVWVEGRKIVLHLIPSGIVRPGKTCVIGNGVVLDLDAFWTEVEMLAGLDINVSGRLFVSDRAHLILPYHRAQERMEEELRGDQRIGTTSRGIGPAYEDKYGRRGLRVSDLHDLVEFRRRLQDAVQTKGRAISNLSGHEFSAEALFDALRERASRLRELVVDAAVFLNEQIRAGRKVLLEGAQGLLLDVDLGTYPYVTSSSAGVGGACSGSGISPRHIHGVLGVAKAYCTRVGEGPFPSEQGGPSGDALRQRGNEFGASTGRPRRCGWFDVAAMRYAHTVSGFDALAITKLDVLDTLSEIPVCTSYKYRGSRVKGFPGDARLLQCCEPVYELRRGWQVSTSGLREFERLPEPAKDYLKYLEDQVEAEISIISTGADREETILRTDRPGLARLLEE